MAHALAGLIFLCRPNALGQEETKQIQRKLEDSIGQAGETDRS